jgi:hypothetical protein
VGIHADDNRSDAEIALLLLGDPDDLLAEALPADEAAEVPTVADSGKGHPNIEEHDGVDQSQGDEGRNPAPVQRAAQARCGRRVKDNDLVRDAREHDEKRRRRPVEFRLLTHAVEEEGGERHQERDQHEGSVWVSTREPRVVFAGPNGPQRHDRRGDAARGHHHQQLAKIAEDGEPDPPREAARPLEREGGPIVVRVPVQDG